MKRSCYFKFGGSYASIDRGYRANGIHGMGICIISDDYCTQIIIERMNSDSLQKLYIRGTSNISSSTDWCTWVEYKNLI